MSGEFQFMNFDDIDVFHPYDGRPSSLGSALASLLPSGPSSVHDQTYGISFSLFSLCLPELCLLIYFNLFMCSNLGPCICSIP